MDFYKDFEKTIEDKITGRQYQEKNFIEGKSQDHLVPYRSTMPKGLGEYSASDEDKLKMLRYMSTHPTLSYQDKEYLQKKLK